jgi:DNA repair protein RadD
MNLQRRRYQVRATTELPALLKRHRRVVAVSPTGSGKTVIGAAIVRRMRGKRVLWLAHRVELVRQAAEHLIKAGIDPSEIGMLSGVEEFNADAPVLVASIGMFRERPVPPADLIVIDEAHHASAESYRCVLDAAARDGGVVLGLTATPWRLDGAPLGDVFAHMYVVAEALELVRQGAIMKARVYACLDQAGARALVRGLSTNRGDWSRRKLEKRMRKPKLMGDIVGEWVRLAGGLPTLLFATSVAHANDVCARFNDAGIPSETVSWATPDDERKAALARLASGTTKVVCNVALFTEGLDCPPAKCIVVARPTKSLTLHRQMLGRAARPDASGLRPIVLDHAGNVWRLGLPEDPVSWSLDGHVRTFGEAPLKRCTACGGVIPVQARTCPECGESLPPSERELEEASATLQAVEETRVARDRKLGVLRRLAASRGLGEEWVQSVLAGAP